MRGAPLVEKIELKSENVEAWGTVVKALREMFSPEQVHLFIPGQHHCSWSKVAL